MIDLKIIQDYLGQIKYPEVFDQIIIIERHLHGTDIKQKGIVEQTQSNS